MRYKIYILWLVFFSLTIACSKQQEETGKEYLPDVEEAEFHMNAITQAGNSIDGKMLIRDTGEEIINDKRYDKVISETEFPSIEYKNTRVDYSRETPQGVYGITQNDKREYLIYPFPLKVGITWIRNNPEGEEHCQAIGIETTQVRNITYNNCLKVLCKKSLDNTETIEYLAKGVGAVRLEFVNSQGKGTALLVRYK
jgi:hypothetical protein